MTHFSNDCATAFPGIRTQAEPICGWITLPEGFVEEFRRFSSYDELNAYRSTLSPRFNHIHLDVANIKASTKNATQHFFEGDFYSWAMYYETDTDSKMFFYREHYPHRHFKELYHAHSSRHESQKGFHQWLLAFAPQTWDDLVMVFRCYSSHVMKGTVIDWQHLEFEQIDFVDQHLRQTRGLLYWPHQFRTLLRQATLEFIGDQCALISDEYELFWKGFSARAKAEQSKIREFAESLQISGTPLVDIIDQRNLVKMGGGMSDSVMHNNYIKSLELAEFLWSHRAK